MPDDEKGPGFAFTSTQLARLTTLYKDAADAFGRLRDMPGGEALGNTKDEWASLAETFEDIHEVWDAAAKAPKKQPTGKKPAGAKGAGGAKSKRRDGAARSRGGRAARSGSRRM